MPEIWLFYEHIKIKMKMKMVQILWTSVVRVSRFFWSPSKFDQSYTGKENVQRNHLTAVKFVLPLPGGKIDTTCWYTSSICLLSVTSICRETSLGEVLWNRLVTPLAVRQVAITWHPCLSSLVARACPNPVSHPVIKIHLSSRSFIFGSERKYLQTK